MKKVFAALMMVAMAASVTACDRAFNEDCYVNSNYEIECDPFDPDLTTP